MEKLADRAGLHVRDMVLVTSVLEGCNFILRSEQGWVLSRPPEKISLEELIREWRKSTTMGPTSMGNISADVEQAIVDALEGGSLADAVDRWVPNADRPITMILEIPQK